jgi:predicted metal-dependent hydrolase
VDVVILHELVHSLCDDHDQKFYDTMRYYGGEKAVAVDKGYIGCNCDGDL